MAASNRTRKNTPDAFIFSFLRPLAGGKRGLQGFGPGLLVKNDCQLSLFFSILFGRVGTATFTVDPIRTYVQYVPLEYIWTYVRRRRGRGRGR